MKPVRWISGFIFLALWLLVGHPVSAQAKGIPCQIAQEQIDTTISRFDLHRDEHISHYRNLREKLLKITTNLETSGHDVTELKPHLQVLDNRINKFASDYTALQTQLQVTKSSSCTLSQGALKTAIEKARLLAKVVQADALELRNYYFNEIRPAIVAVKAQKLDQK